MKKRKTIPNMQRRPKKLGPQAKTLEPSAPSLDDAQITELMSKAENAFASNGSQTRYFVHDPMGLHSQQEPDGTWRIPLLDGLSSIRGVTNDALSLLESRGYDPFGNLMETQGISQTPFGFTGETTDDNGLVYLRNRYYDPALGVFPSPDPVPGNIRNPMSLNRYSYVQNNPTNWVDPSGMVRALPIVWDSSCRQTSPSCETWLDSAHAALRRGGHWANRAADILQNYRNGQGIWDCVENQPWNIGNVIGFDNPSTGSMAPVWGRIYMGPDYLHTALHCPTGPTTLPGSYWNAPFCPEFLGYVGVLSQELWHTQQAGVDRYSVWGELEAYNFEIRVRQEIGAPAMVLEPGKQQNILSLGEPGPNLTRNIVTLCGARNSLPDFWLYNNEPLVWIGYRDLRNLAGLPDWVDTVLPPGLVPVPQQLCDASDVGAAAIEWAIRQLCDIVNEAFPYPILHCG